MKELREKLRTAVPQKYGAQLDEVGRQAGPEHAGKLAEIIDAGLNAGIPWGKLLAWVGANMGTILSLFQSGLDVSAIVKLISSLFGIFNPDTPEPTA